MSNVELNKYIKHYLEKDQTNSAIMLTAPWGTGKSHYIKNELIPFIDPDDDKKCIVVSLYGLSDLHELSKSLYMEVRAKSLTNKSEKRTIGKIAAKTIIKGVASFFGIDLSAKEEDLAELYESIDLTEKLVVLEDLERSKINIIDLMGYVNNLVEQDGVKVLLVANEQEILKYEEKTEIDNEGKEKKFNVLTEDSKKYLEIKEKTISDTIPYLCDTKSAIENILKSFNNEYFIKFLEDKDSWGESKILDEIFYNVMLNKGIGIANLRSFIYACQKTNDIFQYVDETYNIDYLKYLLLTNTAFALRKKRNDKLKWKAEENYSSELGTYAFPLPKFCYNFICFQELDHEALKKAEKLYCEQKEFERQKSALNNQLNIIYSYHVCSEKELAHAIQEISNMLDVNSIPFIQYGKLANYLFVIKYNIGYAEEIEHCKDAMLKNLETANAEVSDSISFHFGIAFEANEQAAEFQAFKGVMLSILNKKNPVLEFDYSIENLHNFYEKVAQNPSPFLTKKSFAKNMNIDKLIDLISICTAEHISDIRGMFNAIYRFSNVNEYFSDEKEILIDLREKIENLIKNSTKFDKIQLLQLRWFTDNLKQIINSL